MFSAILWFDLELTILLEEKRLDLGLVVKMAILSLQIDGIPETFFQTLEEKHHERWELSRYDFFILSKAAREKEVDPNILLSYAFNEALLEILRL
ncbi:hypothetical protein P3G55_06280 [Leptospira sp. 96542]|nr:hypothetical protein [Leptospira sp. 96542]